MARQARGSSVLSRSEEDLLLALGPLIVPEAAALSAGQRAAFLRLVDSALAEQPWTVRTQARAFLALLRLCPRRASFLRSLQDSRWALVRKGFWGLKALVYMGYYGRPEVWDELAYRPSWEGNERLRHGG